LYVGCLMLLERQVMCEGFSDCYDDICLWTNGSDLTQSAAQTACQQRNSAFLPRVSNDTIQSKLAEFRRNATSQLGGSGFWIDVKQAHESNFRWIDGSSFAGLFACTTERVSNVISIYHRYFKNM